MLFVAASPYALSCQSRVYFMYQRVRAVHPRGSHTSMSEKAPFPKLRIWSILFWMTCTSVVASRTGGPLGTGTVVASVVQGGALTAAAIVVYTCIRHSVWRSTEPGHWCAFAAAWEYLDMSAVTPMLCSLLPNYSGYIYCITFVGIATIYSIGTVIGRWEWYWKVVLSLHAGANISSVAWRLSNEWGWSTATSVVRETVTPTIGTAAVIMMLIAIIIDLRSKRYRDWLHWCGLGWPMFKWYVLARAYILPRFIPPPTP